MNQNNSVEIWIERGDILIQLGEIEAAKFNFKQALDQHPKNEELEYRISGIYFELNKFKKGFKYLLIALHRNPEYVFILEELFFQMSTEIIKNYSIYKRL